MKNRRNILKQILVLSLISFLIVFSSCKKELDQEPHKIYYEIFTRHRKMRSVP